METLTDRARRFALPALVLLTGLTVAWFVFVYERPESLGNIQRFLENQGKVLVVGGDDLVDLNAPGTELVSLAQERGISRLLEGRDEAAVVLALERRGYKALLADTRLARLDELARVSVKTRLALYRPLERFTADYLTERVALYKWHEPFEISKVDARRLIAVARQVLEGGRPPPAERESEPLRRDRPSEVAVVLRGQGKALIWRSARRRSLLQSTVDAALALRDRWETRQARRHGPLPEAVDRLNVELEIFHDYGRLADRSIPFLWRAVEPGIYGAIIRQPKKYRYQLPSTSVYSSLESVEDYLASVSSEADLGDDGWRSTSIKLERFRTVHFRETRPGGEIQELYRGIPPVGEEVLRRGRFEKAIALASDWLVDNQRPNGLFMYSYFPNTDKDPNQRNIVRHGLAAYSLAMTYEFDRRPTTLEAAKRALQFMLDNTRFGEGPPSPSGGTGPADEWQGKRIPRDMAFVRYSDADKNGPVGKMGAVAAAVFTLSQLATQIPMPDEWRRYAVGYGNFFLFMQKEDGSFHHYYCTSDHNYYNTETTIYPGEILLGLSRVYGMTHDEKYAEAFDRGMRYYERWWDSLSKEREPGGTYSEPIRVDLVQFVPWISMAMNDMFPRVTDPARARAYARFGIEVSDWIVDEYQFTEDRSFFPDYLGGYYKMPTELPAMHGCVYTEGTAAAYNLARSTRDERLRRKLLRATLLGCRYAIQQIFTPGVSDFWVPNPRRARGGVRYSLNGAKLRIDYSYHSISAIWQALKFMPPEDLP
ncbi:MAG: hypothetical protein HYY06_11125 [Deltaproteobacteria bacterium]|nr:hypothetical protein [Deltaproteobacteria bacterium]